MRYPRYRQALEHSYAFGHFATRELLRVRPQWTREVVFHGRLAAERRRELEALCALHDLPWRRDDAALEGLAHRGDVGVMALFDKVPGHLDGGRDHLLLVRPRQFGNLGTVMRSMLAFGFLDLALVEPTVDPFSPHVVRASVGALFSLETVRFPDLDSYRRAFGHALYPFAAGAERTLDAVRFRSPFALVFGPEWPGLPAEVLSAGTPVAIPQEAGVESLNLAVATSIALYCARQARMNTVR